MSDILFTAAEIAAANKITVKQVSKKLDLRVLASTKPPTYDFVIPGLLRGSVGALVCAGGTGKSMALMEAAATIACIQTAGGRDLLGWGIEKQGRVVYLAGEDPEVALHHRFCDVLKHFPGVSKDAIFENLDLHSMTTADRDLMNDDWADWLIDTGMGARLIGLDTFSRFHLLNENDTADAKKLMRRMERIASKTGAALLFLHHVNKSSVGSKTAMAQQAARGSSVFIDDARWASSMEIMSEGQAKELYVDEDKRRMFVKWNISKQNYSAPRPDVWLKRNEGGVLLLTNFVDDDEAARKYAQASQTAQPVTIPGDDDDDKY